MPDLSRIQSLIVQRATGPAKAILFFRFDDVRGARAFLRDCLAQVPSAAETPPREPPVLHLSFSWRGLSRLAEGHHGLQPEEGRRQLEPFYVEPMPSHPAELGFVGESAPERWWSGNWSSADIDFALHGFFADEGQGSAEIERLRGLATAHDVTELTVDGFPAGALNGRTPEGGILHFGFRDGITAPAIDWAGDGSEPVDFREVLLGYYSDDYPVAPFADGPWKELVRDGSFGCIAWIEQHAARFNRFLKQEAAQLAGIAPAGNEEEWLASRMMGRWRDGSPVIRWPDAPPPKPDLDDNFGFASDPDGRRCPLNAHMRVANMRDDPMTFPNKVRFPKGPPRFQRRGFSYGPPLEGDEDDGVARGLVGTFFCARVNEQFFTALRWIQATTFGDRFGHPPYTKKMQDALFGARQISDARATLPIGHDGGVRELALQDFITLRGVAQLLMPSLPSLALLAADPGQ